VAGWSAGGAAAFARSISLEACLERVHPFHLIGHLDFQLIHLPAEFLCVLRLGLGMAKRGARSATPHTNPKHLA